MNQILSNLVSSADVIVVSINFQLHLWALIIIDDISSYSNIKLSNSVLYGRENAINCIFKVMRMCLWSMTENQTLKCNNTLKFQVQSSLWSMTENQTSKCNNTLKFQVQSSFQ